MLRHIILASLIFSCSSIYADVSSIYTDNDFQKKVLSGDDLKVVIFTAPWCHYCHKLKPIMKKLSSQYDIYSINTDNLETVSNDYNVDYLPSVILFKNGKEVDRIIGFANEEKLITTFNKKAE